MRSRPSALVATIGACCLVTALAVTAIPAQAAPRSLSASTHGVAASPRAVAASVVWDECRASVPARARCGHIRTLADPLRPELGRQRVGFELYRRHDRSRPSLGTLVAHEGGPGYPSTGSRGYYLGLFRPLADRHDVLLVDKRGTGTSGALMCEPLQRGTMPYVKAVAACGKQLGERADTYGTAYGADDMAQVLDALGIDQIDLYGDSYGTFFAQTFALRHPDRVRTLVLDASYPVSGSDPWWRDTNRAISDALTRVCSRDPRCAALGGSSVARVRNAADQLHRRPIRGAAYDAEGDRRTVKVDGVNLALVTAYATYGTSIYRELDAAVRAYRQGYDAPLLRITAENLSSDPDSGSPVGYSAAEYVAVICNDYPQLWDVSLPPGPQRRQQYRDAVDEVQQNDPRGFDPFRVDDWIDTGWVEPRTCIGWPAPTDPVLPEPPGATYPDVPTLVLSGDLDSVTSPEGGLDVAGRFPDSTFVSVPNVGHVTAMGDRQGCAAGIVRRFVRSGGTAGDTSCVSEYVPVRAVPRFARAAAGLDPATQGTRVTSSRADRQVVSGAMYAAADVLTRWYNNYSGAGVGLRGGTFRYSGSDVVDFRLRGLEFVRDVAVTGTLTWNRDNGRMRARVLVDGPSSRDGRLTLQWNDWAPSARATVVGRLDGRPVDLSTPAP